MTLFKRLSEYPAGLVTDQNQATAATIGSMVASLVVLLVTADATENILTSKFSSACP